MDFVAFAKSLLRDDVVILDTETTGLNGRAEVLQVAVIDTQGNVLLNTLVKPTKNDHWPEAQAVHGITPEMVADAPPITDVIVDLARITIGKTVVVYNAPYDRRLLAQSLDTDGDDLDEWMACRWEDVMMPYADFWGDYSSYHGNCRWQKLTAACQQQGVVIANAHDALGDCQMTLALLRQVSLLKEVESHG